MSRLLEVMDLGVAPYEQALELQRSLRLELIDGQRQHDMLLLVEHPPVYTLGRGTKESSLPQTADQLRQSGAQVVEIERGGDVTWHGPGQLVGYPILDLNHHRTDLHWYLRTLESAMVSALASVNLHASTMAGRTGVWVSGRKIASIGIHVKQWVTMHGFALNVHPDLSWFERIVPCGINGVEMTSVARELGNAADKRWWSPVRHAVIDSMASCFNLEPASPTAAAVVQSE